MAQLTNSRKVSRHGFMWGGAGYLFGRTALDKLISNTLEGPRWYMSDQMDPIQVRQSYLLISIYRAIAVYYSILVVQNQASPDSGPGQRMDV